jgi:hypothetical protein
VDRTRAPSVGDHLDRAVAHIRSIACEITVVMNNGEITDTALTIVGLVLGAFATEEMMARR